METFVPQNPVSVKTQVRRWAVASASGMMIVASYAAMSLAKPGTAVQATLAGDASAATTISRAIAPVVEEARLSGALVIESPQMDLLAGGTSVVPASTGDESDFFADDVAVTPLPTVFDTDETAPTTAPTTMPATPFFLSDMRPSGGWPEGMPAPLAVDVAAPVAPVPAEEPRDVLPAAVTWNPTTAPSTTKAAPTIISSGLNDAGRIALTVNRTAEVKTSVPVKRVSIGQPEIADVQPFSSNIILVTAKKPGTTQVIIWDDKDQSQSVDVNVEIPLDQLKDLIGKVAPGANIEVSVASDQIVLRGQAPNLTVAKQITDLAGAYGRVQNFIEVAGAQTVAVQVQFAEVSRTVTNSLGVNWGFRDGTSIFGLAPGGSSPLGWGLNNETGYVDRLGLGAPGASDIFGTGSIGGGSFAYFIKALRDNSLLRVLQEPTLTTTSGEPASFLAGGQVAVPVPTDTGNTAIEYKEFGVRLRLTPVVLGNGKIRLVMEAESSELDYANGTKIQGATVPGLRTRRVQNTVELGEGQTMSVAGLLDDSVVATRQSVPGLGDIPVLGQLFRSTRYQRKETELVVLITPRLSGAMNPDQVTPLPGSGWRHPNELEQFAFGDMGGNKEADATRDWNKPASERGLKPGETQKNTTRHQEPAAITKATPQQQQQEQRPTPPPAFMGEHGFTPAESASTGND